jgi:molecular chaperone GrpE (heat shock protein)
MDMTEEVEGIKIKLRKSVSTLLRDYGRSLQELRSHLAQAEDDKVSSLLKLLEIHDAIERLHAQLVSNDAYAQVPQVQNIERSIKTILMMIKDMMDEENVHPIEFADGIASISECRIIRAVELPDIPKMKILETIDRGYYWKERILRKANVVVVK